jgi:hypothetical protein
MSGAYNNGSYEIFVPQTAKGKYQKYANQIVAIVTVTRNKKGDITHAKLYLTDKVDEAMNRPFFAKLGISGSNIGVIPVEENDGECYVVNRRHHKDVVSGMPFLNINAFAKYIDLEEGVYLAHKEPGGVIEFNRKSKPSKA